MSRAITKETRGASVKKIIPNLEVNKGLCLATLTDVEVGTAEISEDSSYIDFRGMGVPRITFIFTEKVTEKNVEPGMYFHSYTAYPYSDLYDKDQEWKWDGMAQTFKHFIDVLSEDNFKDEYADLLDLKLDEGGEYTPEQTIAAWKDFFEGVQKVFKGDKKLGIPVLTGKDVWMKLLVEVKGKNIRKGDFALSGYPGDGLIELYKEGVTPTLRINIAKGESVIPKAYAEPTDISKPGDAVASSGKVPDFMK